MSGSKASGKDGGAGKAGSGGDESDLRANIIFDEMTASMSKFTLDAASDGLKQYKKGELLNYSEVAKVLKQTLENEYKGAWHVIVGLSYGNFVSHEASRIMYFFFGQIGFLCWCHG